MKLLISLAGIVTLGILAPQLRGVCVFLTIAAFGAFYPFNSAGGADYSTETTIE